MIIMFYPYYIFIPNPWAKNELLYGVHTSHSLKFNHMISSQMIVLRVADWKNNITENINTELELLEASDTNLISDTVAEGIRTQTKAPE